VRDRNALERSASSAGLARAIEGGRFGPPKERGAKPPSEVIGVPTTNMKDFLKENVLGYTQ